MLSKNSSQPALNEDWRAGGFGIYIHWPYCEAKCPYCDFNSHVTRSIDHDAWRAAYREELQKLHEEAPGRILNSVFFGGGTPSLMEPDTVATMIEQIKTLWPIANDLEVTLEANPSSVEAERFRDFRCAGINRVSMGIQALNDTDLKRLGRRHTKTEALRAFDIARDTFDRVSFDLIYGRQDQALEDWRVELSEALSLTVDHLSLYQLTIEPGTAFGDRYNAGKLRGLPSDDLGADLYELTQDLCGEAGLPAYEVSNHAKDGAQSRHNLIYWRYGDYGGIGPGAHSRLTLNGQRHAIEHALMPGPWLNGRREDTRSILSDREQAQELVMMSLRLKQGMDLARFEALNGRSFDTATLKHLCDLGMISFDGGRLSVSKQGFSVLNAILAELLNF